MKSIIKRIYDLVPFKIAIFRFLKLFWTPKESTYKHLNFKGPYTIKTANKHFFKLYNSTIIENEIFWEGLTGKWEKESMKLWLKLCVQANSIFDLGANTGIYSLVAKTVNPTAQVYAFEPHPRIFETLRKNVNMNQYDIFMYNKAISNLDGDLLIEDYSGHSKSVMVESITLDSFIKSCGIVNIDLMKIDVETHEPQVMEGFVNNFAKFRPTLLIEILNNKVAEIIFDVVRKYDYLYFNIDENGSVRQTETIEKSDYYNYLLCNEKVARSIGLLASIQ